jgi:cell division protein ZapE
MITPEKQTELKLQQIDTEATVEEIVAGFVPPPRFAHVAFENYRPDPTQPSQSAAVSYLQNYISELQPEEKTRSRFFGRWFRPAQSQADGPGGVYLDGGYGVGKTHLLASAYRGAPGLRAFLSFQELAYTIGSLSMATSIEAFKKYRLVCIDEFELDDVGNTMLAKTFITNVTQGNTNLITTSNTLPSDLGRGRFAAEDFKREIGQIAAIFEVLRIEGQDYRQRTYEAGELSAGLTDTATLRADYAAYQPSERAKLYATFGELTAHLGNLHPIRYKKLLQAVEAVYIADLAPMDDQNIALRFVHFIDKLYDQGIRFRASSDVALPDLFLPEYRDKGYAKKYRRCLSRLHELLQEKR